MSIDMSQEGLCMEQSLEIPDIDNNIDWSEFPLYIGSPPTSPFHGFDRQDIPGGLLIKTETVDGEEVFESISRKGKWGVGKQKPQKNEQLIIVEKRREDATEADQTLRTRPSPTTPKAQLGGTGSRPSLYLLGKVQTKFKYTKLPSSGAVLGVFLNNLENSIVKESAAETRKELKNVWLHHFGPRLVEGKELGIEEIENESRKIIKQDRFIDDKIKGIWKDWRMLEVDSRRPSRSSAAAFIKKQAEFEEQLKKPFNISKVGAEDIIKESGIKDWKEETQHLRNQLSEQQLGCPGSHDMIQKHRDDRKIEEFVRAESKEQKSEEEGEDLLERKRTEIDRNETVAQDNPGDEDYFEQRKKKKKIDVMGKISLTSDRVNVSYQARTMIAASTINALGLNIDDTNINKTTAWRKAQEVRTETAANLKEKFKCPTMVTVHWDGKTLTLKQNIKSNRVCVYLSGVEADRTRKLLGVPETPSGTGIDEANVVTEMLVSWDVWQEVIGMVFDTTASNTGAENGACKFVEEWRKSPILWLACRHHIAELHIKQVVHTVTGNTKDPGVALFKRLKKDWAGLKIDLDDLVLFDASNLDQQLQDEAEAVLGWAEVQQEKKTWPRSDYWEQ